MRAIIQGEMDHAGGEDGAGDVNNEGDEDGRLPSLANASLYGTSTQSNTSTSSPPGFAPRKDSAAKPCLPSLDLKSFL